MHAVLVPKIWSAFLVTIGLTATCTPVELARGCGGLQELATAQRTVDLPGIAGSIALPADGRTWLVSLPAQSAVALISAESGAVLSTATLGPGSRPWAVAIVDAARKAYVTLPDSNEVAVIDLNALKVTARIAVTGHPRSIVVDQGRAVIYVASIGEPGGRADWAAGSISMIDANTDGMIQQVSVNGNPTGLALNALLQTLYAPLLLRGGGTEVARISAVDGRIFGNSTVSAEGGAVDTEDSTVYVGNVGSKSGALIGDITTLDARTGSQLARWTGTFNPDSLLAVPGDRLLVANRNAPWVTVLNSSSGVGTQCITTHGRPVSIAFDATSSRLLIAEGDRPSLLDVAWR
jgi:YVTN family beta-propeller protein